MKTRKIIKSAETGKFVSKEFSDAHKRETFVQTVNLPEKEIEAAAAQAAAAEAEEKEAQAAIDALEAAEKNR